MSYLPQTNVTFSKIIDAKTTGPATIFTPAANYIITNISFMLTAVSGLISLSTMSVGITASSYIDILAATAVVGLVSVNQVTTPITPISLTGYVSANTTVFSNISVAAVGTTVNIKVIINGYFLPTT